jgi:hypothetical protein
MSLNEWARALIRSSWFDVAANRTEGRPVECLCDEAIERAHELATAGLGTITFTANRAARERLSTGLVES